MKNMKKQLILFILGSVFFTSVFAEAGIYTTIINKSNKQVSVIGSSNSNDWINGSKSGFGQDKVYQINPNDQLMIYSEPKHLTNAYNQMSNVGTEYTLMGQKLSSTQNLENTNEVKKIE